MIGVYIGQRGPVDRVAAEFRALAGWLERPCAEARHETVDGVSVYAAWDPDTVDDANRLFVACPVEGECRFHDPLGDAAARVRVHLDQAAATITVDVPVGAPVPGLHATLDGGFLFSDDLRLMRRLLDPPLSAHGVHGLLKWGAAPAPYTLLQGVGRVSPGTVLAYDGRSRALATDEPWSRTAAGLPGRARPASAEEARETLVRALDASLAAVPSGSAVLFSAGVDSPLLAARLAALGRVDTRLVHMSFPDAPAETVAARKIAGHLGLAFHEVAFDAAHALRVLEAASREWADPVGDTSVIVGHRALAEAFELGARGLVDGSAGGTADNRRRTSQRLSRLPVVAQATAAAVYRRSGLWRRDSGRLERVLRLAAGAGVLLPASGLLQNGLDGVAYATPPEIARDLAAAIAQPAAAFSDAPLGRDAFAVAALVQQGAGRWAAKTVGPAAARGVPAVLPFLAAEVAIAKLVTLEGPWAIGASKPLYRLELERHLPRDLVHRRKHAFMAPMDAVMPMPGVREAVAAAVDPGRPLADFVDRSVVARLLAEAYAGRPLGSKQAGFLWTLAFADRWLRGVAAARTAA